ncbi:MAG TPA: GTP-binding protein [Alphaproteobacteria bacterium]|jgi:G3E family GTPase|nr:GTP-binding protein [Alphaproteobacteria bacterium]
MSGSQIPVTLLTGFLGSGKTTLLNHLLKSPRLARVAVIVNEFGEIGIDHDLVETGSEKLVNLPGGCVCCSVRSDLADTLRSLFQRRVRGQVAEFDRVIIETTGLADPAPILQTLLTDPLVSARLRLDGVVVTVDAVSGWTTLDREEEAVRQVVLADRLLLTKSDLADSEIASRLVDRLRALNPGAPIIQTVNGTIDPDTLFDIGPADRATALAMPHDHHHRDHIQSFSLTWDGPISAARLESWLKHIKDVASPGLLRVKGLVNIAGEPGPTVIQGVGHIFSPRVALKAWPSDDRQTRMVFIGHNLDEREFHNLLLLAAAESYSQ